MEEGKKLELNGKAYGLFYCLGAAKEFSKLCGKLEKIGEYVTGGEDGSDIVERIGKVLLILNRWYCKAVACNGEKAEQLTGDILEMFLYPNDVDLYMDLIETAIDRGTKTSVEVKPVPQKNGASGQEASS